jgi:hypothetical protein
MAEMFSMRSYTRVVTVVQIRQKTWPPCDFENSDWSIFKKLLLKNHWMNWIEIWTQCVGLFRTSQETSLPSLVKFCSAVLKKKMKMLFPIGFQCKLWPPLVAILNFQMAQTVTTHVKDIHRNIYTSHYPDLGTFRSKCAELLLDQEKQRVTI